MNRDNAEIIAGIVDRVSKLEKKIFELEQLKDKNIFVISGSRSDNIAITNSVELNQDEIATVVFAQDSIPLYIDTLNLELDELLKELDEY